MTKSRKSFPLRIDPALYEAIDRWAQQDLRSVNGQIEFLLKEAIRAHDKKALLPDTTAHLHSDATDNDS